MPADDGSPKAALKHVGCKVETGRRGLEQVYGIAIKALVQTKESFLEEDAFRAKFRKDLYELEGNDCQGVTG